MLYQLLVFLVGAKAGGPYCCSSTLKVQEEEGGKK